MRFSFTYADIAAASGMKIGAVRMAVHRKMLDPHDLGSVVRFVTGHQAAVMEVGDRCPA